MTDDQSIERRNEWLKEQERQLFELTAQRRTTPRSVSECLYLLTAEYNNPFFSAKPIVEAWK